MSAVGRASGKVILLGEHVVVYGAPALAAGIDRGARAEASALGAGETSRLALGGDALVADAASSDDRARAFAALLGSIEGAAALGPVAVDAASELPAGGGLGSSAALGVAIARAAIGAFRHGNEPPSETEVLARAGAWERVFHGNPSGIDTAAAALGGCFRFARADGARPIAIRADVTLCIGWSGASSSTREMVEGLARLKARKPDLVERAIAGVTALVENARLAIEAGDLTGLGRLIDLNQMILAGLMLSTEPIEALCAIARGAGALGAKLTGAGGGGSVIALVSPDDEAAERVLAAWREARFDGFVARIRRAAERETKTEDEAS